MHASGRHVATAFLVMLSAMMVVPAVRPLFASIPGASEGAMHAFMSVNMLGAALLAPVIALVADRRGAHLRFATVLAVVDAVLVAALTAPLPVWALLSVRCVQGAANVALLSLVMASAVRGGKVAGPGAAVMLAIAAGPPLGSLLVSYGPRTVLGGASLLDALVAVLLLASPAARIPAVPPVARRRFTLLGVLRASPLLIVPSALAFAERFTVGAFVVSFAIYAHDVLHLSDRATGLRYSIFLMSFALATYPVGRLAGRFSRPKMLAAGGVLYGVAFAWLALARGEWVSCALLLAGMSSAMVYAPSLCYASTLAPEGAKATSMALFQAAGCIGMMLGPAGAGILSAVLRAHGHGSATRYPAVFALAAAVQLGTMIVLAPRLRRLSAARA
jgi:MFS transporter, DHA1 family, tetracycline resistance protein